MSEIPESKKPREWIIKTERVQLCDSNNYELYQIAEGEYIGSKGRVKVIEISAYEQLQKQNQELIKALEFYADKENYEDSDIKIDGIVTWYMKTRKILEDDGEIAREVLDKYQKDCLK